MKITRTTATTIHVLAGVLQVLNLMSGVVPQRYQVFVAAAISACQLYMGHLQHNSVPPSAQ